MLRWPCSRPSASTRTAVVARQRRTRLRGLDTSATPSARGSRMADCFPRTSTWRGVAGLVAVRSRWSTDLPLDKNHSSLSSLFEATLPVACGAINRKACVSCVPR